jgi:hypothetical protein
MVPPQAGQVHLSFSFLRKALMPEFPIVSRFSIMLVSYLVLYRLSRCFNASQGNAPQ